MAFTAEVKDELVHVHPVCSHCHRATLAALVRIDGTLYLSGKRGYRLEVETDSVSTARLIKQLMGEVYQLQTNLTIRRSVLHQTLNYQIEAPHQDQLLPSLRDMGVLSESGGLELSLDSELIRKECCAAAYLRGCFLGSGFIANPQGDFHFEMTFSGEQIAHDVCGILTAKGIPAKVTKRRNAYVVYLKSGDAIADFLAFVGAHASALSFEKTRLYKSIRNDVNRITNAELANQRKTINANLSFQQAVTTIMETDNYGRLSPALREIVRLKQQNPDATLKEIGELAQPALSKSAVAHRVRRIQEFASDLKR